MSTWKKKSRSLVVRPPEDMQANFLGMTTFPLLPFCQDAAHEPTPENDGWGTRKTAVVIDASCNKY